MRNEIREIQQRLGITTVLVTHDQTEALSMCDRIAILREGRLEQVGSPLEIYDHPATSFVAGFVGRINELACSIEQRDGGRRPVHKGPAISTRSEERLVGKEWFGSVKSRWCPNH